MSSKNPILSRAVIAKALGIHPTTISRWAHAGQFPNTIWHPDGRLLGMYQSSPEAWVERQTAKKPPTDSS